ncbi:Fructose-1-phosphate phosphatase YqaB [Vibrio cholerae]|nr:Fructose-1-phosphate phosphatase YqaB [Vibrio cholerae]GFK36123.1 Fructose-1-phosphate phosphatase YqaB [Vibrio cholerae]GFK39057.1 Fructose-1-phosphate phosphatase YqaB [Vibrio cholerae]GFK43211.1 Fructose-1-phosphate phosphatase YqaB [Vibrio cholerae]GFK46155.1 Fructose-1-phosphate phosphatase YqaB [Vibrio cholerae]
MTAVNFSLYEGFIFDMDGTLLDTMPAHLAAWEATAKHFDFPFDAQ